MIRQMYYLYVLFYFYRKLGFPVVITCTDSRCLLTTVYENIEKSYYLIIVYSKMTKKRWKYKAGEIVWLGLRDILSVFEEYKTKYGIKPIYQTKTIVFDNY